MPLIEDAAAIMNTADIFILVGTSLQVYPAAGLIHYLKDETPKYVIDKKIPVTGNLKNLTLIEKSATEGIVDLVSMLNG